MPDRAEWLRGAISACETLSEVANDHSPGALRYVSLLTVDKAILHYRAQLKALEAAPVVEDDALPWTGPAKGRSWRGKLVSGESGDGEKS